jgi:2-keto-3-deoxy-L-rhamnonate aldolase RhmA
MSEDQLFNKPISFREKLKLKKPLIGTLLTLPTTAVSEVISGLGFDYLWIDMEHAPLSLEQVQTLLQSCLPLCSGLVRIPVNEETWIKQVLDLGADGIIIPQVKTKKDVEQAIMAAKYPPLGNRSVGIARAHTFGVDFAKYVEVANELVAVIIQIEHKDGVQNIEQILQVGGIDAVVIGPYDLSGSFGKLGQVTDSEVQASIKYVKEKCLAKQIPCGIFSLNADSAANLIKDGFQLIAMGIDIHYLWSSAKTALDIVKPFDCLHMYYGHCQ